MTDSTTATADAPKVYTAEDYLNIATQATGKSVPKPIEMLQSEVNELVKQVTVDSEGKFIYPDGTPEHMRLLVASEKKFRDTQSSFTKNQQTLKQIEEENKALQEKLANLSSSVQGLPQEELERLEELKYTDPEAWYEERQKAEKGLRTKVQEQTSADQELRNRHRYLAELNVGREIPITPELLDNDIPARINNKLVKGELSFEAYLSEVISYLDKGRVVANPTLDSGTNLTTLGSSSGTISPSKQQGLDYSKLTF